MSRSFLAFVLLAFVCTGIVESAFAEEVSAKSDAPALLERAKKLIHDNTPEDVGVGNVMVHRSDDDSPIDDVTYDVDTTLMRIKGHLEYKTGPDAVIKAKGGFDYEIQYQLSPPEFKGGKFKIKVKAAGNDIGDIPIDVTPIKEALEGDIPKLLELIPNGGLVTRETTSEYDSRKKEFQQKYGAENVYFASSDFVRWASPETAGKWAAELIASGGSLAPAIAQEAKTEMRKELTHILTWLEKRAGNAAQQAVESLLNGENIALPSLKLVWQRVEYRSKLTVAGQVLPETPPVPHAAFVLIWETPTSPNITFDANPTTQADDSDPRPKWKMGARFALGPSGSRIIFLTQGGAAEKAGLALNDIIVKCNGVPVATNDNTTDLITRQIKKSKQPKLTVEAKSGTTTKTVTVNLDPAL